MLKIHLSANLLRNLPVKKSFVNRLKFDRIMVMSLWPRFLARPVEFNKVVMLLTFILIIISIPSPPQSFIPGLKRSISANHSHSSLPFLLQD